MDRIKWIWYLSPMRAAMVQASLRISQSRQNLRCSLIQAVSQIEPSDRKSDPWPLWMAGHAVKICPDGMLEDTNSLDGAQIKMLKMLLYNIEQCIHKMKTDWLATVKEQSNQGPHCLPFHMHHLDTLLSKSRSNFRITTVIFGCPTFLDFCDKQLERVNLLHCIVCVYESQETIRKRLSIGDKWR